MARESGVVFLFDENLPHRLVRALREELGESAYHVYDVLHPGAPDEMVLRHAGDRGWCTVSSDRRILRTALTRALISQMGIGGFFLNESIQHFCVQVRTIVRHWPEMKRLACTQRKPFLYTLRQTTILRLHRRALGSRD